MQKDELELRKQQLEVESKKQDNFIQVMLKSAAAATKTNAGFSGYDEYSGKTTK